MTSRRGSPAGRLLAFTLGALALAGLPGCHQQREAGAQAVQIITHADLGIRLTDAERARETAAFLTLLNRYRRKQGLAPLAADRTLQIAAQWMSEDMAGQDYVGHTDSQGRDPFQRLAAFGYTYNTYKAENVAAGHATAEEAFRSWQASPTHNENMLNPHFKFIGVGFAYRKQSKFGWYWATAFGGEKSARKR